MSGVVRALDPVKNVVVNNVPLFAVYDGNHDGNALLVALSGDSISAEFNPKELDVWIPIKYDASGDTASTILPASWIDPRSGGVLEVTDAAGLLTNNFKICTIHLYLFVGDCYMAFDTDATTNHIPWAIGPGTLSSPYEAIDVKVVEQISVINETPGLNCRVYGVCWGERRTLAY